MSRFAYWDQVLVLDGEIPEEILHEAKNCITSSGDKKSGIVENANPEDTTYDFILDHDQKSLFIVNYLESLGVIPKLEGHTPRYVIRYHVMEKGGKMTWHCDTGYSVSVSIYLTDAVGGELQVHRKDDLSQSVIVSPKKGRAVVMKCENQHRVLDVQDGTRESIQVFITYIKDDE